MLVKKKNNISKNLNAAHSIQKKIFFEILPNSEQKIFFFKRLEIIFFVLEWLKKYLNWLSSRAKYQKELVKKPKKLKL